MRLARLLRILGDVCQCQTVLAGGGVGLRTEGRDSNPLGRARRKPARACDHERAEPSRDAASPRRTGFPATCSVLQTIFAPTLVTTLRGQGGTIRPRKRIVQLSRTERGLLRFGLTAAGGDGRLDNPQALLEVS